MTVELDDGTRIHESRIRLQYTWWIGRTGSNFYEEIRKNRKIWGIKCPFCRVVYVPPKENCPKCFSKMHEWVELGNTGTLTTYTVVNYAIPGIQPENPPFALGIIILDRANTGLVHLLGEIDLTKIRVGMRVQAVFNEKPQGDLLDIKYFKPI
ncbi:MAG: Zn-ribbon domain-containing OB-fold protein [Deltaproteobacteria bacterium]|nr:Zn-ribbon domain-containing OB-fold protein [Deltaproteobacteria bacterium]MBW2342947.1 Zn-ribbon domain-containing OB-fold protein [Deltaproteobacteria bacterium]